MRVPRILLWLALVVLVSIQPLAASKKPPKSRQEVIAPYWSLESGWKTSFEIRNNLPTEAMRVTPVLRTHSGEELRLPVIEVGSEQIRSVDLHSLLTENQARRLRNSPYGSVAFQFEGWGLRNIYASTMITMPGHPIGFHFDAIGHYARAESHEFSGVWWMPNETLTNYLLITNNSEEPVRLSLRISGADFAWTEDMIPLGPRQSRRVVVREMLQKHGISATFGGIKVRIESKSGAVQVNQIAFDEKVGFSAIMRMFERPTIKAQRTSPAPLRAPMVALRTPDPALGFPSDVVLNPFIFISNTTAATQALSLDVHWRKPGQWASTPLLIENLKAGETRKIAIADLQKSGQVPPDAHWANVEISTDGEPGDVIAVAASYDDTLRYGTQSPFTRMVSSYWKGGMWKADHHNNSFITAGNAGKVPTSVELSLISSDGSLRYEMSAVELAPNQQTWIDVRELIRNKVPDKSGKIWPSELQTGSYEIRESSPTGLVGQIFEGKLVVDKMHGHAAYGCASCCGFMNSYQTADPLIQAVGSYHAQKAWGYQACTNQLTDITRWVWNWASWDIYTATVGDGTVTGLAPGQTTVESSVDTLSPYPSCEPYTIIQTALIEIVNVTFGTFTAVGLGKTRSIQINLSPTPSEPLTLTLSRYAGNTGTALFTSNGTNTRTISESGTVEIQGTQASSTMDNIRLTVKHGTRELKTKDFTVVDVQVALRNSGSVSTDNAGSGALFSQHAISTLGAQIADAGISCHAATEIVGTVTPSNYTGSIFFNRELLSGKVYDENNSTLRTLPDTQNPPNDTSDDALRDDDPQSGGSGGKIYDLDAPGSTPPLTPGVKRRYRMNFRQYVTLDAKGGTNLVGADFPWFIRMSCYVTPQDGPALLNDLSSDNVICKGSTSTAVNPGALGGCSVQ